MVQHQACHGVEPVRLAEILAQGVRQFVDVGLAVDQPAAVLALAHIDLGVIVALVEVPGEGEILQLGRFEVEIIDMDDRRIDKLLFRALLPGGEASAAEAAGT